MVKHRSISNLQTICLLVLIVLIKAGKNVLNYLPQKYRDIVSGIIQRRRFRLKTKRQKRACRRLCMEYPKLKTVSIPIRSVQRYFAYIKQAVKNDAVFWLS